MEEWVSKTHSIMSVQLQALFSWNPGWSNDVLCMYLAVCVMCFYLCSGSRHKTLVSCVYGHFNTFFFDVNFLVTFYFDVSRISSIPCTLHLDSPIVSLHLSYICFIILLSSFSSPSTSPRLQHVHMRVCTHAHTHACLLLVL